MTSRSPAVVLYDGYGTPVAILEGDALFSNTPALLFAGEDENGLARFINVTSDGALKTAEVGLRVQKQFDISGNDYLYIGTAVPGLATSSVGWSIQRFELNNKKAPIDLKTTEPNAGTWDDRAIESYE